VLRGWAMVKGIASEAKREMKLWTVLTPTSLSLFLKSGKGGKVLYEQYPLTGIDMVVGANTTSNCELSFRIKKAKTLFVTLESKKLRDAWALRIKEGSSGEAEAKAWAAKMRKDSGSKELKESLPAPLKTAKHVEASAEEVEWAKEQLIYAERSIVSKIFSALDTHNKKIISLDSVRGFSWDFLFELERLDPDGDGLFSRNDLLVAVAQVAELLCAAHGARNELKPMLSLMLRQVRGELSESQLQARLDELDGSSSSDDEVPEKGTKGAFSRPPSLEADLVRAIATQMRARESKATENHPGSVRRPVTPLSPGSENSPAWKAGKTWAEMTPSPRADSSVVSKGTTDGSKSSKMVLNQSNTLLEQIEDEDEAAWGETLSATAPLLTSTLSGSRASLGARPARKTTTTTKDSLGDTATSIKTAYGTLERRHRRTSSNPTQLRGMAELVVRQPATRESLSTPNSPQPVTSWKSTYYSTPDTPSKKPYDGPSNVPDAKTGGRGFKFRTGSSAIRSMQKWNTVTNLHAEAKSPKVAWMHALEHNKNQERKSNVGKKTSRIQKLKVALIGDNSSGKDRLMNQMARAHAAKSPAPTPRSPIDPPTTPTNSSAKIKGSSSLKKSSSHGKNRTMSVGSILGMTMVTKEVTIEDEKVDLSLFSLTGGDQYLHIVHVVVTDAAVLGFVFSCMDPKSLNNVKTWYLRVHKHRSRNSTAVVIGTHYSEARKSYTDEQWRMINEKARRTAKKAKAKALVFCDTDTGVNIEAVLPVLLRYPLRNVTKPGAPPSPAGTKPELQASRRFDDRGAIEPAIEWFDELPKGRKSAITPPTNKRRLEPLARASAMI